MSERAQLRVAARGEASGSGPTREGYVAGANPGATGKMNLFGEVLLVGVLVTLVGLALVTLPAALAGGIRHLRRFVQADDSRLALFWQDVRSALAPGLAVGAGALVLTLVLLIDIDMARSGALPGGWLVGAVGVLGLAALAVALLTAAGAWTPEGGWRTAVSAVPKTLRADPIGALYVLATCVFVAVATWALPPLIVPALGCAALAAVAIPVRRRETKAS